MAETKNTKGAPVASEHNQNEALVLKYKNLIFGIICAVIVCVGVGFFVKNCTTEQFNTASTDMAKAQEYFSRAILSSDSALFVKALNGDSISTGFVAAAEQGGEVGNLAKLYAGLCYAQLGKMQEAANYLEQFDGVDDEMVSPAALGALGNVKAALGQLDEAVATLVKAAEKADNNTLSPQFLIQAGDIRESQGKKEEALKLYKQIKAKYVNSVQYRSIDAYIERVK